MAELDRPRGSRPGLERSGRPADQDLSGYLRARRDLLPDMVSLTRLPDSLPRAWIAVTAMLVLAGLDVLGALLARRFAHSGSLTMLAAGAGCFLLLFWVYASSLRYAELIPVTFGWIAALQVGLLIAERIRTGTAIPVGHWCAAAGLIALEGYLLFSSSTTE